MMKNAFFLACRYLKPRRSAVSLITITSILGVTLGVAVLMVVMAVMTGFSDTMKAKLIETQAHFQIRRIFGAIRNPSETERVVAAVREAAGSSGDAAPVIQGAVLIQYGPDKRKLDTQAIVFAAPEEALKKHIDLSRYLVDGDFSIGKHWRRHDAVISADMSRRWQLGVGDRFLVHSAGQLTQLVKFNANGGVELDKEASAYLPMEFTVAGIYSLGKSDFDRVVLFIGPEDAADLFNLWEGEATAVFGWGKDPFHQEPLLQKLRLALPGYEVVSWEEANRKFLDVLQVEKSMMFFLLIFIVLVAAFSIANTLITSVYQKTREIGLLKALGCSDALVMEIFLMQGFLVGLFGSIVGTLLGWLVIRFRNDILHFSSRVIGIDLFPKQFYFFDGLPAHIIPADVAVIAAAGILLCTLGALLPALRAARLEPAEALRYE